MIDNVDVVEVAEEIVVCVACSSLLVVGVGVKPIKVGIGVTNE